MAFTRFTGGDKVFRNPVSPPVVELNHDNL
jgi:hypothetical protein